jgi:thiaminase
MIEVHRKAIANNETSSKLFVKFIYIGELDKEKLKKYIMKKYYLYLNGKKENIHFVIGSCV